MLLMKMIICWWRPPRSRPWGSCDFPPSTLQTSCNRPEDGWYLSYLWASREFEMIRNIYLIMNSTCFKMIPFGVVFLTFSRAAAASSVLGISVTTCLTKFIIWISTRFELHSSPIILYRTLTTDLTRLLTSADRSPPFSSSKGALTSLEVWCSLSLVISIISYQCCNLRLLTPKSFAESRQAARRAGYSPGFKRHCQAT